MASYITVFFFTSVVVVNPPMLEKADGNLLDTKNPLLLPFVSDSSFAGAGEVLGRLFTESFVPLIDNPPVLLVKLLTIG